VVEPFHLFRTKRTENDGGRFLTAAVGIIGKRIRYAELTGKTGAI
jgi:hypothetical protein